MGVSTTLLVESKFYLPLFNMAIFDGPFRLYFSQSQESEALRMYFELHELIGEKIRPPRAGSSNEKSLFVLMYPDTKICEEVAGHPEVICHDLGDNQIVAVSGPVCSDSALRIITEKIGSFFEPTNQRSFATAEA